MRPKVLFTASTCSHILNFHLPYLRRFREAGWQVHVGCAEPRQELAACVDEVLPLPFCKKLFAAANFRAAWLLCRKIRTEGYRLICTHTSLAAFFTRLALLGLPEAERPRVANMVHGYLFDAQTPLPKRWLLLAAEKLTAGCTDLLLTMNSGDYAIARRHKLGRRIVKIPGVGVDFGRFDRAGDGKALRSRLGIGDDRLVMIYAAEFSVRKSQAVLIRALAQLPERFVLVLAGDGATKAECGAFAARLGLAGRVYMPGQVGNMPEWLAAADIAVTASRSEGLPFNVMEAMYAGLPVVASAVRGHLDLLEDEVSSLLYPYGDAAACARQLARLVDPDLRCRLVERAKQDVRQYALEAVLPQVWREYETLF